MKTIAIILLTAALVASITWRFAGFEKHDDKNVGKHDSGETHYFTCSMHPWIKESKPGKCPICGMTLVSISKNDGAIDAHLLKLSENQINVVDAVTAEAKLRKITRNLNVAGTIMQDERRRRIVSAYAQGRIDKLFVNYVGAETLAGKPLAKIYSSELLQAEREYRQLSGALRERAALRLLQLGLERDQISALPNKPEDELDSEILSPLSGVVIARYAYEGKYVAAGEPLFEIADLSRMWFNFDVYEADLPNVKVGQEALITTPSVTGRTFSGKISFIEPTLDPMTRATKVRVETPNPLENGRRVLFNGAYAEGKIQTTSNAVLAIPRSAIIYTGKAPVVFVEKRRGEYERRAVIMGRIGDTYAEITAGVQAGEKVVVNCALLMDSQAELNNVTPVPVTPNHNKNLPPSAALTSEQSAAALALASLVNDMAAALASDNLAAYNKVAPSATPIANNAAKSLLSLLDSSATNGLRTTASIKAAKDLPLARRDFLTFSVAVEAALRPLRKLKNFPKTIKVYECGMADKAIPGAPRQARWLQLGDRSVGNPFFGSAMQTCGELIAP